MQNTFMGTVDLRVDAYIERAAGFAVPVLNHIRQTVHACCPEVEETMKWSFPHFVYRGSNLCSMASFKSHCTFGFWLGSVMEDTHGLFKTRGEEKAMGQWGHIRSVTDLPKDDVLAEYIHQAMRLIENGIKLPKKPTDTTKELEIPDYFRQVLQKNPKAASNFQAMSYSHRKEYLQWITEAKTEPTRLKRMGEALEWISEGKGRNWKYER